MSGCGAAFSALFVLTPPATVSEKLQIKPRAGAETLMLSQNRTSPLPNHSSARSRSLYVGSNPPRPKILSAEIELSRTNALIVNFTITVNQPSYVYIEYHSPTDGRFRSSTRMIQHTDTANGNVLMSNRHLNQVISIAPNFQSLEWRLGGLESSFHFSKSEDRFYHQHSVKELSNGDILLFDNGNSRPQSEGGSYSRALQLRLDFGNMTAVKVWEYRHVPDLYADCCSSVDRLPNGNTIIDFGFNSIVTGACCRVLTIVEANSAGQTVAEMKISGPGKQIQYRVHPINSLLGEARIRF